MTDDSTNTTAYSPPVDQLLTLGPIKMPGLPWPNYLDLGLSIEHVPDLLRMTGDQALNRARNDSLQVWAPVHAWRVLGQLGAASAVTPLLDLLDDADADDWMREELPRVFAMIGSAVMPELTRFLHDSDRELWARIGVSAALKELALREGDRREEVVATLSRALSKWYRNNDLFNAFIIGELMDLDAVETAALMEAAFLGDRVDINVNGDWEDVQVSLGLLSDRITPPPNYWPELRGVSVPGRLPLAGVKEGRKSNVRSKRKAERAARKRNRRRK